MEAMAVKPEYQRGMQFLGLDATRLHTRLSEFLPGAQCGVGQEGHSRTAMIVPIKKQSDREMRGVAAFSQLPNMRFQNYCGLEKGARVRGENDTTPLGC